MGLNTEAHINLQEKISVGLKYEWHFFDEYFEEPLRGAGVSTAFALTTDYYVFNRFNNRVFIGATIGSFNNSGITESGMDVGGSRSGISPRVGYEFEFLRITAEYNHTFKDDFPNFIGIGFGLNIEGRYK